MTGRTSCECSPTTWDIGRTYIFLVSTRAKIRDCVDGYNASNDYWLQCLYKGEKGNPENVEEGFLKSTLLVKVWVLSLVLSGVRDYRSIDRRSPNRPFK